MSEITEELNSIDQNNLDDSARLLPLVYEELRKLATQKLAMENPGQTLQATDLVHEAYLRLEKGENGQAWGSRGHFFFRGCTGNAANPCRECKTQESHETWW